MRIVCVRKQQDPLGAQRKMADKDKDNVTLLVSTVDNMNISQVKTYLVLQGPTFPWSVGCLTPSMT
jgi:hypothetical protein